MLPEYFTSLLSLYLYSTFYLQDDYEMELSKDEEKYLNVCTYICLVNTLLKNFCFSFFHASFLDPVKFFIGFPL